MTRNLGGAIGVAALETFVTKREQYHSSIINSSVSLLDEATRQRLAMLQHYFLAHGVPDPAAAMHQGVVAVGQVIRAQSLLMGYGDAFGLIGAVLALAAGSVALLRKGAATGGGAH
jgi:MFS transporter, DHA2 family, multidrug resistance protein